MNHFFPKAAQFTCISLLAVASALFLLAGCGKDESPSRQDKNNNGTKITSIDFRLQGFEGGRLGGDFRCRAEGLGTETPNLRIDKTGADDALIFNGDRERYYAYTGTTWLELPYAESADYTGLARWAATVARQGPGTYERTYKERWTVTLNVRAVNPALPPSLFLPPENANIRRPELLD